VAAGPWSEVGRPGCRVVEYPDHVLLPGLVNAHVHLELSHLAHLAREPVGSFTGWVRRLVTERDHRGYVGPEVRRAARCLLEEQAAQGVVVLADIGNTGLGRELAPDYPGLLMPFLEFLGLREKACREALAKLAGLAEDVLVTGHAPYTTHPRLLTALKARSRARGAPFPIHVAEPRSEQELLARGQGELVRFLEERSFYCSCFRLPGIDILGSVQYLHALGVLDRQTLCVHGVHVQPAEMKLLRQTGASVCLCPGSNRFLGVGRAPVAAYLEQGITLALGTDSAASCPRVSLWSEMALLAREHPGVTDEDILVMATLGGARALEVDDRYGCLAPGRRARFLAVRIPSCGDGSQVFRYLVREEPADRVRIVTDGE